MRNVDQSKIAGQIMVDPVLTRSWPWSFMGNRSPGRGGVAIGNREAMLIALGTLVGLELIQYLYGKWAKFSNDVCAIICVCNLLEGFLHLTNEWAADERLLPWEYVSALGASLFSVCPVGTNAETFRFYEALETNTVPLLEASLFSECWLPRRHPLPVVVAPAAEHEFLRSLCAQSAWRDGVNRISLWIGIDHGTSQILQQYVSLWWRVWQAKVHGSIFATIYAR